MTSIDVPADRPVGVSKAKAVAKPTYITPDKPADYQRKIDAFNTDNVLED